MFSKCKVIPESYLDPNIFRARIFTIQRPVLVHVSCLVDQSEPSIEESVLTIQETVIICHQMSSEVSLMTL